MPRYYNAKRSLLPLELPHGSTVVPAKSFIEIAREDEGHVSVVRAVNKKLLIPPKLRPAPAPKPAAPVAAPEPSLEAVPAEESSDKPKSKSRKRTRR